MKKLSELLPWKRPKDRQRVITPLPPSSSEQRPRPGDPVRVRIK